MTTYGAYNAGLPCKNWNCKSHGKPHPNCKCYGDYSDGGEVEPYCSTSRAHKSDCEYFADGGIAGEIPNDAVVPDARQPKAEAQPQGEIPAHEVVPDAGIPNEEVKKDSQKPGSAIMAGYEGAWRGLAGPVMPAIEAGLAKLDPFGIGMFEGLAPEKQAARQEEHAADAAVGEAIGLGAGILTGTGTAGVAAKTANATAKLANLGTTGSAIIKGAISNGLIQGADEVSKMLMGTGNPEAPVGAALAHTGMAALIGGGVSGAASKSADALKRLSESKIGNKFAGMMAGIASAAQHTAGERAILDADMKYLFERGNGPAGMTLKDYFNGQKAYDDFLTQSIKKIGPAVGTGIAHATGQNELLGYYLGKQLSPHIEKAAWKVAPAASRKFVLPVALQIMATGGKEGLVDALGHAGAVASGHQAITKGVDTLFKTGLHTGMSEISRIKNREKLDKWLEKGGIDQEVTQSIEDSNPAPQGFAKGGEVSSPSQKRPGLEAVYPDQAMMMNNAKARISNYLMQMRPQKTQMKLAFDAAPVMAEQKRAYNRALDIANAPLSVLEHIKNGTIQMDHIKHLRAMHPEVLGLLQQKATERVTKAQLDGERPGPKIRQGLSMILGTALSSDFKPENIQAAQSVFKAKQPAQQQPQQGGKPKRNTSTLSNSDRSYLTAPQARQARQQRLS